MAHDFPTRAGRAMAMGPFPMTLDSVLVAILCHDDLPRLVRCVQSARGAPNVLVMVNTGDEDFREQVLTELRMPPYLSNIELAFADRPGAPGGKKRGPRVVPRAHFAAVPLAD